MTVKNEFGQSVIVDQWMPIAKAQEAKTDAAYHRYTEAAEKLSQLFDKHKVADFVPDVHGGVRLVYNLPKENVPAMKEYLLAAHAKEEAEREWKREANKHGHMLHPGELK